MFQDSNLTKIKKSELSGVFDRRDHKKIVRVSEWSDLSGVRLKRMILALVDKENPKGMETDLANVRLIQGTC